MISSLPFYPCGYKSVCVSPNLASWLAVGGTARACPTYPCMGCVVFLLHLPPKVTLLLLKADFLNEYFSIIQ